MLGWKKHKLKSRLLGKNINNLRYADDTTLMAESRSEERRVGKEWKQCQTLFSWAPKSLQMVTTAMNLKDTPLNKNYDQRR